VPGFWDKPQEAQELMQDINSLKTWVNDYNAAKQQYEDLEILKEFFDEGDVDEAELEAQYESVSNSIENIEFKNMLSGESDKLTAVLQVTAGAGGTESCDWAEMLMRMYMRWAENKGY